MGRSCVQHMSDQGRGYDDVAKMIYMEMFQDKCSACFMQQSNKTAVTCTGLVPQHRVQVSLSDFRLTGYSPRARFSPSTSTLLC
jgi:hypothetical protein